MRDYQKNRVYNWETKYLPNGGIIQHDQAQSIVDHIWSEMGLQYPPRVRPIPLQNRHGGDATRLTIRLQPITSMKTIIHEVAHSMTSNLDGESGWHGPYFVGMYVKLLHKFMNVDLFFMLQTLAISNVEININAVPIFED